MNSRIGPIAVALIAALLLGGLAALATDPPPQVPAAPAPAAPEAPVSGSGDDECAEDETGCPETKDEDDTPAEPAAPSSTTTTTRPYSACTAPTDGTKPNIRVARQQGVTLPSFNGRQAHYAFPEAERGNDRGDYWEAWVGYELDGCLPSGGTFYLQAGPRTDPLHATSTDITVRYSIVGFSTGENYAEYKVYIYHNNDEREHAAAHREGATRNLHLVGHRPGCVEFFEIIPSTNETYKAHNEQTFGTIETALIAVTGNMPHCSDRH